MEGYKENPNEQPNTNKDLTVGFEKKEGTTGAFNLILEGQTIGTFTLFDPEKIGRKSDVKVKQIGYVIIYDEFKGKGLGKKFYIQLNEYLQNLDGSFLGSGDDTTIFADRVWESLFKDGLVVKSGTTLNGKDSFRFYNKQE